MAELEGLLARTQVLVEALPYLRSYQGKVVVVKYGGNAMINDELKAAVMQDLALLKALGLRLVVVHGGGPEINAMLKRVGKAPEFIQGLRVTDAETMEIVQMVLSGKLNKEIVARLGVLGVKALGLSGHDMNLLVSEKIAKGVDLGFVGQVVSINTDFLHSLLDQGVTPVISTIGCGKDGESYNINADTVAGEIAAALGAEKLVMITDVEGIYAAYPDPASLVPELDVDGTRRMIAEGKVDGGMIPKVEACLIAVEGGVGHAHIIDGRKLHTLLLELVSPAAIGTKIYANGIFAHGGRA